MYHYVLSVLRLYTTSIRCLCSTLSPYSFLVCNPPPLHLHARLAAGPGEEPCKASTRALAALLHSCLAMDEKQRQKCLWFKVHPGNYSE